MIDPYLQSFENFSANGGASAPQSVRSLRLSASTSHVTNGRKLLVSGDAQGAMAEFMKAAEIDPGNEAARQEIAHLQAAESPAPAAVQPSALPPGRQEEIDSIGSPVLLRPVSNEPLTLHMAEDAKVVYQAVGRAAGGNVLFEPE